MAHYAKGKYGIAARERKERKKTNHRLTQMGPGGGRRERSRNSRKKAQNAQKKTKNLTQYFVRRPRPHNYGGEDGAIGSRRTNWRAGWG